VAHFARERGSGYTEETTRASDTAISAASADAPETGGASLARFAEHELGQRLVDLLRPRPVVDAVESPDLSCGLDDQRAIAERRRPRMLRLYFRSVTLVSGVMAILCRSRGRASPACL
jgi:hypothetical protein